MTAGRCCRAVRAAVFAAVCVLLAALGHVLNSGSTVPWWSLAAGWATTGGAGWILAGRERGLLLVVGASVAAQGVLHTVFSAAQRVPAPRPGHAAVGVGHGTAVTPAPTPGTEHRSMPMGTAHHHTGHTADPTGDVGGRVEAMGHGTGDLASTGMVAAHLLAALLCGLWLAHGERAAFRVLRAVAGLFRAPLLLLLVLPAPTDDPRPRLRQTPAVRRPRRLLLVRAIPSRGPPEGVAVS